MVELEMENWIEGLQGQESLPVLVGLIGFLETHHSTLVRLNGLDDFLNLSLDQCFIRLQKFGNPVFIQFRPFRWLRLVLWVSLALLNSLKVSTNVDVSPLVNITSEVDVGNLQSGVYSTFPFRKVSGENGCIR